MSNIPHSENKHIFYKQSVKYAKELRVHADGEVLGELITDRRPAESKEIQDYRDKIFQSKTQGPFGKIMNALRKIRKSSDWNIRFDEGVPSNIPDKDTLKSFSENEFHKWTSLEDWYFSTAFKVQCIDANAIVLWLPKSIPVKGNEIAKPFPVIYPSDRIIDYVESSWYILESIEKVLIKEGPAEFYGEVYYYVTKESVTKFVQFNAKGDFKEEYIWRYSFGRCPITYLRGVLFEQGENHALYQSHLSPIVPEFNEAGREYSDLQAEIVQHIHSTLWAYEAQKCKRCKGASFIRKTETGPLEPCDQCSGTGKMPFNPYEHVIVSPPKPGDAEIKAPFAGYIEKSTEIAVLQDKRIQDHLYYGLASLNMEHLAEVPLNISGEAKAWDHQEANTFVYTFAEDLVKNLLASYKICCDIMYEYLVKDQAKRDLMLPTINIPEKYDMFSESHFTDELKKLTDSHAAPAIIREAQIEIAAKKFNSNPEIMKKVRSQLMIDPFGGTSEDTISDRKLNQGISDVDYLVHCNIVSLVEEAYDEDKTFCEKPMSEQKKIIYSKATKIKIEPPKVEPYGGQSNFGY